MFIYALALYIVLNGTERTKKRLVIVITHSILFHFLAISPFSPIVTITVVALILVLCCNHQINEDGTETEADNLSETVLPEPSTSTGLKILFLSSDTGGGHRASAESLAKQFQILFPGSTYDLLDVVGEDFGPPYNSLVSIYKHLSAHPAQWKLLYNVSNSRGFEMLADAHFKLMFERSIRRRIKKYNPDVVVRWVF